MTANENESFQSYKHESLCSYFTHSQSRSKRNAGSGKEIGPFDTLVFRNIRQLYYSPVFNINWIVSIIAARTTY